MPSAPEPHARGPAFDTPTERAAAELQAWIEGGERVVALVAPRGAERRGVLERLSASLGGRFAVRPWSGRGMPLTAARAVIASEVRNAALPALLLVEEGEGLGPEGARVLRALTREGAGARCAVVALEAEGAGRVLGELGSELEVVVLRGTAARPARRRFAAALALGVAGASLGMAVALLLPRFGATPAAPPAPEVAAAAGSAEAADPLPPVTAPPPEPAAPRAARAAPQPAPRAAAPAPAPRPRRVERAPRPAPRAEPAPPPAPVPGPGWLVVNAIPRAAIHLDGSALGETPIVRHPVASGRHRVAARFGDGREQERSVHVDGGEVYLMFDGR